MLSHCRPQTRGFPMRALQFLRASARQTKRGRRRNAHYKSGRTTHRPRSYYARYVIDRKPRPRRPSIYIRQRSHWGLLPEEIASNPMKITNRALGIALVATATGIATASYFVKSIGVRRIRLAAARSLRRNRSLLRNGATGRFVSRRQTHGHLARKLAV